MNSIHGVIICGGNATRFAESVGKSYPYPKHLEMLGDKSVLGYALDGLVANIPISSVTFILNPNLEGMYVDHLKILQESRRDLHLSYAPEIEEEYDSVFTKIKKSVCEGVYTLDGQRFELGNPVITIALGDLVITEGNTEALKRDVATYFPDISDGKSFAIFRNGLQGLIYWVSRISEVGESRPDISRDAQEYFLKWWNCNAIEDLLIAKRDLGYPLTEDEIRKLNSRFGRERM